MLQQGRLNRFGVFGPTGSRDRLDRVGDDRGVLDADLTGRERRGGVRIARFQRFAGQAAAGTEPFHRQGPFTRLDRDISKMGLDQLGQTPKAQRARHIPRVQLGQHRKLPELQPSKLRLQLHNLGKQQRIRSGAKLLDHIFDSIGSGI
jgi:hypothetical protein